MSAAKAIAGAARAAAGNRAVRAVAATAAAKAATRAEPVLRERYDRWSGRRMNHDRAVKLARQIRGRYSEDTIIGGEPHFVVWKDDAPVEAFPPVADLEVRPELRDFDERLAKEPPPERAPRRLGRRSRPR
jgi:20S proteasome alpha/beta subunit